MSLLEPIYGKEVKKLEDHVVAATIVLVVGIGIGAGVGWAAHAYLNPTTPSAARTDNATGPRLRGPVLLRRDAATINAQDCGVVINGNDLADYREKYNVALACGIADDAVDRLAERRMSISSVFTIRPGEIPIRVAHSQAHRAGIAKIQEETKAKLQAEIQRTLKPGESIPVFQANMIQTWHDVVLLPKNIESTDSIRQLSDVPKVGGIVINALGMAP